MALLYGNITGPGMVQIPGLYQSAGWVLPTALFFLFSWLAGVVSLYLVRAIALLPGNRRLQQRVEFAEIARAALPRWAYLATMALIIFNLLASNTSAVVVSAQTMDATLLAAAGHTCAVYVYPAHAPACVARDQVPSGSNSAFGGDYVISLGWMVVLIITIPLGLLNLDDNIWVQIGGMVLLSATIAVWTVQFIFFSGLELERTPTFDLSGAAGALSTIAFNYGLILTIPSWLAEKGPGVRVSSSIWLALSVGTAQFLILGLLGAWALDFSGGNDVLAVITDPATPRMLLVSKIGAFVLPLAALITGIPIFSIIIRYNLLQLGVPILPANLFSVGLPWLLSLVFFAGNQLNDLITWSSAVLTIILNFVLPVALYIVVRRAAAAHDAAVVRAAAASGGAATSSHGSLNASGFRGGSSSSSSGSMASPPASPSSRAARPKLSLLGRLLLFRTPSAVDRRLEALTEAHREDDDAGGTAGTVRSLKPPLASPIELVLQPTGARAHLLGAADHEHPHHRHYPAQGHTADSELRLAPAADGLRDEVEDAELVVPCCLCGVSPNMLAWTIAGFAILLNIVTLGLQIDGAVA